MALDVRSMKNTVYYCLLTDTRTVLFIGMGLFEPAMKVMLSQLGNSSLLIKHQIPKSTIVWNLVFSYYHLPCYWYGFLRCILHDIKQELVFSVKPAGNSRLGMQENRDELPRPISCAPEGCRNWNASVWERGWSMWVWSLSLPHFKWQNIPGISFEKDIYITCELVGDCLARNTFW